MAVTEEYNKTNAELDDVVAGMAKILRVRQQTGELSEQLQAHLDDLKNRKNEIYTKCVELKRSADEMDDVMLKSREAKIRISGNIYKGTVISINDHEIVVNRDTSFTEYSAQNGIIVGTVIVV